MEEMVQVEILLATILVFTPAPLQAIQPPARAIMTTSGDSEQSFVDRADSIFKALAHGKGYITRSQLRAEYSSPTHIPGDQPVPFQLHEARFGCIDSNRDGRISAKEYKEFTKFIFQSASVHGFLNLANEQQLTKYQNALKRCPLSSWGRHRN